MGYRLPRHRRPENQSKENQSKWEWVGYGRYGCLHGPEWFEILSLAVWICMPIGLMAMAIAAESAPIPRKGQFCPIDYYRTGEYCIPSKSTTPSAIRTINKTCPIGTYTQSDYCINAQ